MLRLLTLALLFLSQSLLAASPFSPILFQPGVERVYLRDRLAYLDNTVQRTPEESILAGEQDARFQPSPGLGVPLGYPKETQQGDFWLGLQVANETAQHIAMTVYGSGVPSLSRVFLLNMKTLHEKHIITFDQKLRRAGRTVSVPPGTWKIYVELKRDVYSYPIIFLGLRTYQNLVHQAPERYFIAVSFGICMSLLVYNLVLAFTLRSVSHSLYVAYNLAIVLYFEVNSQLLAEQFGSPELPLWTLVPINTSAVFFFLLFLYNMLGVPQHLPHWKKVIFFLLATWPIIVITDLFDHILATRLVTLLVFLAVPFTLLLGMDAVRRKVPVARALLATMILPPLFSVVNFLANPLSQWLPIPLIASSQLIGIDLEMILLSMTVGYKIRQHHLYLRRKRDHAYGELKKIVYPHQVKRIWDGESLDKTMPVGVKDAYCLVFDVIGSSKLPVQDPREFLSRIFRDCSALMMERYNGESLVANAYRVKEMGDGFLCTVGFPFGCPQPNAAEHSLKLAFAFMQIFHEHAAQVHTSVPMHCAVGIALGPVEAYYPESGAQVYDLFGRGIILATRYESMRDLLFPHLKVRESIVVLQKAVYDRLDAEQQRLFTRFELDGRQLYVRDDEEAPCLYYRLGTDPYEEKRAAS